MNYCSVTSNLMGCNAEPKVKHLDCEGEILRFAQNDIHRFMCNGLIRYTNHERKFAILNFTSHERRITSHGGSVRLVWLF
jgi:hypothetical protein